MNKKVMSVFFQLANEFNPIHAGHVEVGEQQVYVVNLLQFVQRILTIAGEMDLAETQRLQQASHLILLGVRIIDHQGTAALPLH